MATPGLGESGVAVNVGFLYSQRGDSPAAEAANQRADQAGNGLGAFGLGSLLARRDEPELAKAAFQRADERGEASGTVSLAEHLLWEGDRAAAERNFQRGLTRAEEQNDQGAIRRATRGLATLRRGPARRRTFFARSATPDA